MNTLPIMHEEPRRAELPRPLPGAGTRLTANELGYAVSMDAGNARFPHPFKPALSGFRLKLSRGLINEEFEPKIGTVPIGGLTGQKQPALTLRFDVAKANESWICVEVEPDDQGELIATSRIEIVHTNAPRSIDPKIGRGALAQVLWRNQRPFAVFEIVDFNLRYERILPAPGGGAVRHFFF